MPAKFERCVQHVKDSGKADGVNPWAVCHASTGELKAEDPSKSLHELDDIVSGDASFPPADASYKHSGNMVPTESDHSYENTSAEENLKEIDDMISKSASFPTSNSSFKHKTSGLVTRPKPNTFGNTGNETVSIPGSLSAVKIKGKKREGGSMMQETVYKAVLDTKLNKCGCLKKKRLTETQEGGPGSGRKGGTIKPTYGKGREDSNPVDRAIARRIAGHDEAKEGGPGSGPQPGGGKKQEPVIDPFSGPELPEEPEGGFNDVDVQAENIWAQSSPQERSALVRATMNVTPQLADDIARNDSLSGAGSMHLGTDKAVRNHLASQGRVVDPDTWEDDEFNDL